MISSSMEKPKFSGIEIFKTDLSPYNFQRVKILTRIICLIVVIISNSSYSGQVIRLSDPILETDAFEIFGVLPTNSKPEKSLKEIVTAAEKHDGEFVRITTKVSKVCQRKGCFFIAVEGNIWARIVFEDYAFFIPTDSSGRQAMLEGTLTKRVLSEELAKHYSEDLEIEYSKTDHHEEYLITASSVLLMK